ncbi:hypothetical protein D6D06_08961 [Aureobasidium pullulans]|nr:hypothetical protein D6D06_08961 [Aureobasidium pullulans]THX72967.1 hypothetical protein D6D05_07616 [Aureobasidium pullulans]TIA08787.1 hypothetical protein D6C80_09007 [Aureobasidium pullulans]
MSTPRCSVSMSATSSPDPLARLGSHRIREIFVQARVLLISHAKALFDEPMHSNIQPTTSLHHHYQPASIKGSVIDLTHPAQATMPEPPQKRRKNTARLLPEQHNVITRVPRVEERRSIRVATQLRLRYSTRSPFFRLLPLEIRNMIYKSCFESMARAGDQRIEPSSTELLHKGKMVEVLGLRGDTHDFCPLDIFLVYREMHKEAEPVLWSEMNFLFRSTRLLNLLSTTKQLAHGRPSRSIPLMYPVEKIRGIEVEFSETYISDLENDLKTLECFWNLAKRIGDKFELRITYPDTEDNAEQSEIEAAALKTIFSDMRVYQARREAAGQKLRVSKTEMLSWIDDDPWKFLVNFPDPSEVINTGDESQNIS